jgi:hypothetical protein
MHRFEMHPFETLGSGRIVKALRAIFNRRTGNAVR